MAAVKLRPIRTSDAGCCYQWLNDSDVIRHLGLLQPPTTIDAERAWIARVIADRTQQRVFVIEDEQGRSIGTCGLRGIDREAGCAFLGIVIGEKKVWDRGYGTAATGALVEFAFTTLNLREVRLSCHQDNRRGLRCYQKVGFTTTTAIHEPRVYGGSEVRMAIDRQRWAEMRSRVADPGR
jgi:RimJ/RimL family protein N-acetyltransferase